MGAVQKLATMVMVGLVALATLLVIYLADEPSRRAAEADEKEEVAIERGIETYLTYCVVCHGPAGEGSTEKLPDGKPARIGMPLGGNTEARLTNQSENPVERAQREEIIRKTLHNGRGAMPAWGAENGGELNDEQIEELVLMIQHADWNVVYNDAIHTFGGYPTPQVAATEAAAATTPPAGAAVVVTGHDIYFDPTEITVRPGDVISLPNAGGSPHNFAVDALGISVDMPVGETVTATIPADAAPGEYEYYCNVPGHKEGGMVGKLIVTTEDAAPPAEASPAAGIPATDAAPAADITVVGPDTYFDPTELSAAPGATITLPNEGVGAHNFAVDALGISVDMPPGETVSVTIPTDAQPGVYEYYCNVPGHKESGMVGTLTIT